MPQYFIRLEPRLDFSTDINRSTPYQISRKSVHWQPRYPWTDTHDEDNRPFFANICVLA